MNINDLYKLVPEELHGNISVSKDRLTITSKDGKYNAYNLGDEIDSTKDSLMPDAITGKAREVKGFDGKSMGEIQIEDSGVRVV